MNAQDKIISDIFGTDTYLVGGAVRDVFGGLEPKDRDYLVLFLDVKDIGGVAAKAGYGVSAVKVAGRKVGVRITGEGLPACGVDVCPPRREVSTGEGHTDFNVVPISAREQSEMSRMDIITEDMSRRDWTANAMAVRVKDGLLIDPFGGEADIRTGNLMLVNERALDEDPLRILRGMYLMARLGLRPSVMAVAKITRAMPNLVHISRERIGGELNKIILQDGAPEAFRYMAGLGMWKYIDLRIDAMVGFDQRNEHHNEELFQHCVTVLEYTCLAGPHPLGDKATAQLRWAAFLHDIGKLATQEEKGNGYCRYHGHAEAGANMAAHILFNLRFPRWFIHHVATIITHHMIEPGKRESQGRRFRAQVANDDVLMDVFRVRYADMLAHPSMTEEDHIVPLKRMWRQAQIALHLPCFRNELAIDGNDIMRIYTYNGFQTDNGDIIAKEDVQRANAEEGKIVGKILDRLTRDVIGDPTLNNREWLLRQAEKYRKELAT